MTKTKKKKLTKEQRDMAEGLKKYKAWKRLNEKLAKWGWT